MKLYNRGIELVQNEEMLIHYQIQLTEEETMGGCFNKPKKLFQMQSNRNALNSSYMGQVSDCHTFERSKILQLIKGQRNQCEESVRGSLVDENDQIKNLDIISQYSQPLSIIDMNRNKKINLEDIVSHNNLERKSVSRTAIKQMQVNSSYPFGIKNLPPQWQDYLSQSNMISQDIISDPKSMMDIISMYSNSICKKQPPIVKLLTNAQFQNFKKKVQFRSDHPSMSYTFQKQLSSSSICRVFRVLEKSINQNQNSQNIYAAKMFKIDDGEFTINKVKNQITVMTLCQSKNILKYHFSYYYRQYLYVFIQYMDGGNLTKFIKQYQRELTQDLISYILKEILLGLKVLHRKNQIHRDIKSDNILINSEGQIKIGDFGNAFQATQQAQSSNDVVGTPAWMAPELIKKQNYTNKVDIWSLGIVTIQLATGQPPYLRLNQLKAMYMIISQSPPKLPSVSVKMTQFLDNCLQKDPHKRENVQQLLKNPFIIDIGNGLSQKEKIKNMVKAMIKKNANL